MRVVNLFDSTVEEFKQFAFKRYNDVLFTILCINLLQFSLVTGHRLGILNVWVVAAEEALKDLEVFSLVCVTGKPVLSLGHTVLQTVLSVLVVHSLHQGIRENFVRFANARESLVSVSLLVSGAAHRMVAQGQLAVSLSNLFTVGRRLDLQRLVVPGLVAVHFVCFALLRRGL